MTQLRSAIGTFLTDWLDDVPAAWRAALAGAEPDIGAVDESLTLDADEVIFPLRKQHDDPRAPAGSHVLRALDIDPHAVRAVLVGQDPYPRMSRATGRSFDQGDLEQWSGNVSESLRRMVQSLAQFRQPAPTYVAHDRAWRDVRERIHTGLPVIEHPRALFDRWETAGVLCLNLGLTFSRFEKATQEAHMRVWKPVVEAILVHLASRQDRELLIILWGARAQDAFDDMGVMKAARAVGSGGRVVVVRRSHPGADGPSGDRGASPFLRLDDAYTQANEALARIGAAPIDW